MYKKIREDIDSIRSGKSSAERVILIVPAQSTLRTEEDGFRFLGEDGFFDFAVVSGAKLRSDILNETGHPAKTPVNTIGRKMLLRRIASKRINELSAFKSVCKSEGFIEMAGDFIVQLKQNEIGPEGLKDISEKLKDEGSDILLSKLRDMQLIFADYEEAMSGKYTDSEDLLAFATEKVKESEYVGSSIIWYYDFYSFTEREYAFLKELSSQAKGFSAAVLAGDKEYVCGEETAKKLSARLGIQRCILDAPVREPKVLRRIDCSSPYAQSRTIAADILEKYRNGVGYGDMIVLTQDMEGMGENLKRVLTSFGIPVFMDEKRSIRHSVSAKIVSSSLDAIVSGFRRQAVLAFLKSGALGFSLDEISLFENYVKQYKIYDKGFLKPFKYGREKLGDEKFGLVESIRAKITECLEPFAGEMSKASTAAEKSAALYNFLTGSLCLPALLDTKAKELEDGGFLEASQEVSQSFESITGLMNQMAELFGDEVLSNGEYADIFVSGFEDIKIGVLPQAEGKVRIGSVTRTGFSDVKVLYIAGFNDGIIPSDPSGDNILTESEIFMLSESGHDVAKNSEVLQKEERYQIERALNTDTEETVVCVCLSDFEGEAMRVSPLLLDLPPGGKVSAAERDIDEDKELKGYFQSRESIESVLPEMLREMSLGKEVPEIWKLAYNGIKDSDTAKAASEAVFFRPEGGKLEKSLSKELFEKTPEDFYSPTQLEVYSSCPFKHFIGRGLNPEDKDSFDVGSAEIGDIDHLVLMRFSESLKAECKDKGIAITDPESPWMTVSDEEISRRISEILKKIEEEEFLGGVMSLDEASEYRISRTQKVCEIFAKYMIGQVRKGVISEMFFEQKFGYDDGFPAIEVNTGLGKAVIKGTIDRVDILGSGSDRYVKIIDYKTGNRTFDKGKFERGLDLQLMIYLEGALGHEEGLKPAGVFYYAVKEPDMDEKYLNVISNEITEDMAMKMTKEFSLDGVVVNDSKVLSALDTEIKGGSVKTSVFKPGQKEKNIISSEEMEEFRKVFSEKLTEICYRLMSGDISIEPAIYKKKNVGCQYCDFASVCLYALK